MAAPSLEPRVKAYFPASRICITPVNLTAKFPSAESPPVVTSCSNLSSMEIYERRHVYMRYCGGIDTCPCQRYIISKSRQSSYYRTMTFICTSFVTPSSSGVNYSYTKRGHLLNMSNKTKRWWKHQDMFHELQYWRCWSQVSSPIHLYNIQSSSPVRGHLSSL